MSCYHPLRLFRSGTVNPKTGKDIVLVTSHKLDYVTAKDFDKRFLEHNLRPSEKRTEYQEIPCGICIGCRVDASRRWAARALAECQLHESNYFITLTYDDEHLPKDGLLHKEDVQKFLKRLRKYRPCRYLLCGEYGDQFGRPHYHACMFGLELYDLKPHSMKSSYQLFFSPFLSKVWGKGFVLIGDLNYSTASYITRYVLKKRGQWTEEKKPFYLMSRKPGIGAEWFEKNIHEREYVLPRGDGGIVLCGLPHYLRVKNAIEAGNADRIMERELNLMRVSDFSSKDDFRDFREFLDYHPLQNK